MMITERISPEPDSSDNTGGKMNNRIEHLIKQDAERIVNLFAGNQNTRTRASTKIVRRVLINAPYIFMGRLWDVKAKSLGAGIYELSLIPATE
jgi:hypothetical protein